jgi:hypothetical protein
MLEDWISRDSGAAYTADLSPGRVFHVKHESFLDLA